MIDWKNLPKNTKVIDIPLGLEGHLLNYYDGLNFPVHIILNGKERIYGRTYTIEEANARLKLKEIINYDI
jgi:hypothetical protein